MDPALLAAAAPGHGDTRDAIARSFAAGPGSDALAAGAFSGPSDPDETLVRKCKVDGPSGVCAQSKVLVSGLQNHASFSASRCTKVCSDLGVGPAAEAQCLSLAGFLQVFKGQSDSIGFLAASVISRRKQTQHLRGPGTLKGQQQRRGGIKDRLKDFSFSGLGP